MKIYLKNRTQLAKLFLIDRNYILGFLIGEYDGNKIIKKLNGEIIRITNKSIDEKNTIKYIKNEESLSDFEVTDIKTKYGHVREYRYKDGSIVYIPLPFVRN